MRIKNQIILIAILLLTLALASCSSENMAINMPVDQNTSIPSPEATNIPESEITDDDLLYNALKEVEDQFELISVTRDVLDEIGAGKIISISILQQNELSGMINLDYNIETEIREIKFAAFKVIDPFAGDWIVNTVSDAHTGNFYWLSKGLNEYMDLYDYSTGDLVSEGKEELNIDNIKDDYEKRNQEILDEFNKDLEKLSEEYNLDN